MSEDLKACPFCGANQAYVQWRPDGRGGHVVAVFCDACDASTAMLGTPDEAVAAWNYRTPGWIRAEDGLPGKMAEALVWYEGAAYVGLFTRDWDESPRWIIPHLGGPVPGKVSHWMPKPTPPEP